MQCMYKGTFVLQSTYQAVTSLRQPVKEGNQTHLPHSYLQRLSLHLVLLVKFLCKLFSVFSCSRQIKKNIEFYQHNGLTVYKNTPIPVHHTHSQCTCTYMYIVHDEQPRRQYSVAFNTTTAPSFCSHVHKHTT